MKKSENIKSSITFCFLLLQIVKAALGLQQDIRLESSIQGAGRVEIFHNNQWGSVCSTGFTAREARVVCRMADLPWSGAFVSRSFGPLDGVLWLSNVTCVGNETRLDQCSHDPWGDSTCTQGSDVGVVCTGARLVSGDSGAKGRLEIFYNNTWGTVCETGFTNMSAKVACSMVGQPTQNAYYARADTFGQGRGPVWLTDVQCAGYESSLGECRHSSWGDTPCNHSQDVGVVCSYAPEVYSEPSSDMMEVTMGDNLEIHCVIHDANPPHRYIIWSHNGRNSSELMFHIANVTQSDEGRLMCTAYKGSYGCADTFIRVLEKCLERRVSDDVSSGDAKWTTIHTAAVVTGVVAVVTIAVLVVVVVHLYRKPGSYTEESDIKRITIQKVAVTSQVYDEDQCMPRDVYENPYTVNEELNQVSTVKRDEKRITNKNTASTNYVDSEDNSEELYMNTHALNESTSTARLVESKVQRDQKRITNKNTASTNYVDSEDNSEELYMNTHALNESTSTARLVESKEQEYQNWITNEPDEERHPVYYQDNSEDVYMNTNTLIKDIKKGDQEREDYSNEAVYENYVVKRTLEKPR